MWKWGRGGGQEEFSLPILFFIKDLWLGCIHDFLVQLKLILKNNKVNILAKHVPKVFGDDRIITNISFFYWNRITFLWFKIVLRFLNSWCTQEEKTVMLRLWAIVLLSNNKNSVTFGVSSSFVLGKVSWTAPVTQILKICFFSE